MKYFNNITDFEQAKKRYRELAKQMHPDRGGSSEVFQQLQQEYQAVLLRLQKNENTPNNESRDILSELGKLAKTLVKNQIPQKFMQQKIKNSTSPKEKLLYTEIINLLNRFI